MRNWASRVRERLADLDLDPATETETVEELTQHLEDRYRDLVAAGASAEVAAAQAWTELDGHPRLAREISAARRAAAMPVQETARGGFGAVWEDMRFALRRLRHTPGFTLVALLTVMLTVGANTAILSVADAVLFRPLAYADPDNVAIIQVRDKKSGRQSTLTPYAYLEAIADACPSVSDVGLLEPYSGTVRPTMQTADGERSVPAMEATPNYFELLGVRAVHGRTFTPGDAGREGTVAVLSYSAWQQMFGGDASIVGKPITLGTATFDLLGVLPRSFVFPSTFAGRPSLVVLRKPLGRGVEGGTFHPIVRIASGVSHDRAQAEVEAAAGAAAVSTSDGRVRSEGQKWQNVVPVLNDVRTLLYPVGRPIMRFLFAAALFILLLGCANLANMMLVRGRRGLHDTAVRLALGASRARLIRPMIFEALVIGGGGALLAVALTSGVFDALLRQVPPAAYGRADVGVDYRVFLIALSMGLFCAVSFSIVPAWRVSGIDVVSLIQRRGGRGSRVRLGRPLVAVQAAIAIAVVFGAVVAGRAFVSILRIPVGFSSDGVVLLTVAKPAAATSADYRAAMDRIIDALRARPDVEAAGAAGSMPFSGRAPDDGVRGVAGGPLAAGIVFALPGYPESIGLTPVRGRTWTRDEGRTDPDSAVVSESAAKLLFGDRDPIGATFDNGRGRQFHVIGVVGDVRNFIDRDTAPVVYAMPEGGRGALTIVAKARSRGPGVLSDLKSEVRKVMASGLITAEWWEDTIASNNAYRNPRFQTIVLTGLAVLALGLTALGIFSVVGYLVAARTRELGVRLAVGASPGSVARLVIREALVPVAAGIAAGVLLIQLGKKLAEAQLFKVDTGDPIALVAATATVLLAASAAAWLPARRASRINPTDVLRAE
ncbi:MAG TPA: ABC transporter permease [Vicinamibacterales bacterium]|nr:ABC transporter permease [Vicinamibacterales bacterium]